MNKLLVKILLSISVSTFLASGAIANGVDQCASEYCASIGAGSACASSPAIRQHICGG